MHHRHVNRDDDAFKVFTLLFKRVDDGDLVRVDTPCGRGTRNKVNHRAGRDHRNRSLLMLWIADRPLAGLV